MDEKSPAKTKKRDDGTNRADHLRANLMRRKEQIRGRIAPTSPSNPTGLDNDNERSA